MKVFVTDPYVSDDLIVESGCIPIGDFRTVLPETDFLTVHCPLNDKTRHMVGADEFSLMKSDSFVINCARGGIVHEEALTDALNKEKIAGAGVDVFETEPTLSSHPFLANKKIYLSPHSAGVSIEAARRMSYETADNLINALQGSINPATLANPEILE